MLGKFAWILLVLGLIFVTGYDSKITAYASAKNLNLSVIGLNITAPETTLVAQEVSAQSYDYRIEVIEKSTKRSLFGVAVQIGEVRKYTDRDGKVIFNLQNNNVDILVESGWGMDPVYKSTTKMDLDKSSTNTVSVAAIGSFLPTNFISLKNIDYGEKDGRIRVPRNYQGDWIFTVGTSSYVREPQICIDRKVTQLASSMTLAKNSGLLKIPDELATKGMSALSTKECFDFGLSDGMVQEHTSLFYIRFEFIEIGNFNIYLKDNACNECKPTTTTFIVG